MKVGQLKSRMPPPLSLLLLLLLSPGLVSSQQKQYTHSDPLPSLYVPISAGSSTFDLKLLQEDFGVFGRYFSSDPKGATPEVSDEFVFCGKKSVKALNQNFLNDGANTDIQTVCEPSPDRIIVRVDGKAQNFGNYQRDLKKECELLTCSADTYPPQGSQLGQMNIQSHVYTLNPDGTRNPKDIGKSETVDVKVESGAPERAETNVCNDKKPGGSSGGAGSILLANEGHCFDTYAALQGLLEPSDIHADAKAFVQIPRWLQPGERRRNIRSAFYDGEHSDFFTRLPYSFKATTQMNSLPYRTCSSRCDSGNVVKLMMKNTQYSIAVSIEPQQCTGFRICLSPENFDRDDVVPTCNPARIIDVLVKNGIVIWPNEGRASLIELFSPKKPLTSTVTVEFGYGVTVNGQSRAEYYIGNDHREIVTSTSKGFKGDDSRKVAFFFPNENCLKKKGGVFTRYAENGKALSSDANMKPGESYKDDLTPMTAPQLEVPKTTTMQPIYNFVPTTTLAPLRVVPGAVSNLGPAEQLTDSKQRAVYKEGKWWTWGIYLGFVIGTLLTLGIGGGLFFLLRRTVFAIWYRGMYKRYGCDVSGTTGGLTGVGFGNTVTGDVTVQGTTGGTTIGSTGTSTGGGTTGGTSTMGGATETSTLLDKTEGTKSIAM